MNKNNYRMIIFLICIGFGILFIGDSMIYHNINKKLNDIITRTATQTPSEDNGNNPLTAKPTIKNFKGNFESANFAGWSKGASRSDSIQIIKSPVRAGKYAVKFTIKPGDIADNGHRAELTCNEKFPVGSEVFYKFSFMIPKDYAENDLWQMFTQFHDQPDFENGETWDSYTNSLKLNKLPPPVSLSYHNNEIIIKRNDVIDGYHVIATAKIEKGKWVDLIYHVKWSLGKDGFIEVFKSGKSISKGKIYGPNVYNSSGNYLKIGFYRDKNITTTNTLYFDEVYISQSKKDIFK